FQFPQDENPQLAREGWAPRLMDYFYVSLTNAMAFSPTDAMPLTRPAKTLMAADSTLQREVSRPRLRLRKSRNRRRRGGQASMGSSSSDVRVSVVVEHARGVVAERF